MDNLTSTSEELLKKILGKEDELPEKINLLTIIRRTKSKIFKYWALIKLPPRMVNNVWDSLQDKLAGPNGLLEDRYVAQALLIKQNRLIKEYAWKFSEVSSDFKVLREGVEVGSISEEEFNQEAQKYIPREIFATKNPNYRQKNNREYLPVSIYKGLYSDYNNNYIKYAVTSSPETQDTQEKKEKKTIHKTTL